MAYRGDFKVNCEYCHMRDLKQPVYQGRHVKHSANDTIIIIQERTGSCNIAMFYIIYTGILCFVITLFKID